MARPAWMREALAWVLIAAAASIVGQAIVNVVYYPAAGELLIDDAYFFVRYARNFLATGSLSWNLGEPPIHGATSQLHQLIVIATLRATGGNDVAALQWSSNTAFVATACALAAVADRAARDRDDSAPASTVGRLGAMALALTTLGCSKLLMLHARSGMDTMLAVVVVAVALLVAVAMERAPEGRLARAALVVVPALAVVGHLARADLVPLVVGPFVALAWVRSPIARRMRVALALSALGLVATLAALHHYYGTALPLAFYVKHGPVVAAEAGLRSRFRLAGLRFLGEYATTLLPLLLVWAVAGMPWPRARAIRGALAATGVFVVYHALLTLPIMGYAGRFFVPTLPIVVALGALGVARIVALRGELEARRAVLAGVAIVLLGHGMTVFDRVRRTVRIGRELGVDAYTPRGALERIAATVPAWPALAELSRELPLSCTFAGTEDGLPSVLNPTRVFIDMSGLHNTDVSLRGDSVATVLTKRLPDIFYLPPADYTIWVEELAHAPAFARYELFRTQDLGYMLDVAVRKDSPCYAAATARIRPIGPVAFYYRPMQ